MNLTKTTLTQLLATRLDLWDQIDEAYRKGLVVRAISLQESVNNLTNQIRGAYGL